MICPKCKESMIPNPGKDYLLCSKHWGYPDMIEKGMVKARKKIFEINKYMMRTVIIAYKAIFRICNTSLK